MCHCAENRGLLRAALAGEAPLARVAVVVGANMAGDVRVLATQAAGVVRGRVAAAKARLAR